MNRRIGLNTLGIFLALVWIFPVYWMLNTAFLPLDKVRSATPTFMPFGGELSAFKRVFTLDEAQPQRDADCGYRRSRVRVLRHWQSRGSASVAARDLFWSFLWFR